MKASYTVRPGLTVEVEAETQGQLYEELASAAEVFGERACGRCGGTEIVPVYRTRAKGTKVFHFAEWRCTDPKCGATLSLGVRTDNGRLFPKRRLDAQGRPDMEKGTLGDHGGWTRYAGPAGDDTSDEAPHPAPPHSAPPTHAAAAAPTTHETPKPATPPGPGQSISAAEWQQIQDALKARFISPRAYLERYGYGSPRDIMARHFGEALAAAQNPDEELREAQRRVKTAAK